MDAGLPGRGILSSVFALKYARSVLNLTNNVSSRTVTAVLWQTSCTLFSKAANLCMHGPLLTATKDMLEHLTVRFEKSVVVQFNRWACYAL